MWTGSLNFIVYHKTESKLKSFENAYFIDVADELYIREARHIQGEYVLQASDLLEGVNFSDKIAMGSYPLDIQSTDMNNNGYVVFDFDRLSWRHTEKTNNSSCCKR